MKLISSHGLYESRTTPVKDTVYFFIKKYIHYCVLYYTLFYTTQYSMLYCFLYPTVYFVLYCFCSILGTLFYT